MIKIIQYGEGNFLRSFVDLYFDTLNKEGEEEYRVNIVKPIALGSLEKFYKQKNKYNVVLQGFLKGKNYEKFYHVDVVDKVLNPFENNEEYYKLALDKNLKILVSNTTEAGICFDANDDINSCPNITYPAKVTKFLYKRYKAGLPGLYLLPVELIENNADELYKCVDKYIDLWHLEEDFRIWNNTQNYYCNTLVDRIVSGYPRDEEKRNALYKKLGYQDELISIGEPFGLWVIQNKGEIKNILKDGHHNIDVIFADDIAYYKKRKVRVLNGSHTNLVPISLWKGKETVYEVMQDKELSLFVDQTLKEEIIPFVSNNIKETTAFAESVKERFLNPFLNHQLTSIALNSISKWKARVLPSFLDYYNQNKSLPMHMVKGLAYLIKLYQSIELINDKYMAHLPNRYIEMKDDVYNLTYFINGHTVKDFLNDDKLWGIKLLDIENLENIINKELEEIKRK